MAVQLMPESAVCLLMVSLPGTVLSSPFVPGFLPSNVHESRVEKVFAYPSGRNVQVTSHERKEPSLASDL